MHCNSENECVNGALKNVAFWSNRFYSNNVVATIRPLSDDDNNSNIKENKYLFWDFRSWVSLST